MGTFWEGKVSIVKIIHIKSAIARSSASSRSNGGGPSSAPVPRNRGRENSVNSGANSTNSTLRHPIPDAIAHDVAWYEEPVSTPIDVVPRRRWNVQACICATIVEWCGFGDIDLYSCFLSICPHQQLKNVVEWTSKRLIGTNLAQQLLEKYSVLWCS